MRRLRNFSTPILLTLAAGTTLTGCTSTTPSMEEVAKNWCMTIRAGQILPVYPLSEDVQPGDVFLVEVPVADQTRLYQEKGFLALDQHIARLPVEAALYEAFYGKGYWSADYKNVPHFRPGKPDRNAAPNGPVSAPNHLMVAAPRVAFPTYTFSVSKGGGLNLALPLSGVPVGLGVMNATKATGSVSLQDAFTYGLDIEPLMEVLDAWWATSTAKPDLVQARQATMEPMYLRVVHRVFTAHRVVVSLTNQDATSAGLDAGAASVPDLLSFDNKSAQEVEEAGDAYRAALEALSGTLNSAEVGGSIRFAQASSRSVTMDETFARPLVVGYLGFDVPIYESGELGPPIPSFSLITGEVPSPIGSTYAEVASVSLAQLRTKVADWAAQSPENQQELKSALERNGVLVGDREATLVIMTVSDKIKIQRIASELNIQ